MLDQNYTVFGELIESGYRIIYVILPDRIDIVTVRDTRRVLPRSLRDL